MLIENNLSENWFYERVDPTMRAIISLGVYELSFCVNTPHNVIIDEYVSIAGLFFNKTNTGFVNGILDSISKIIRENEETDLIKKYLFPISKHFLNLLSTYKMMLQF